MESIKDNIVNRMGGASAVAEICGITQGAVSQWRKYIPTKYVGILLDAAKQRKIDLDVNEFFDRSHIT